MQNSCLCMGAKVMSAIMCIFNIAIEDAVMEEIRPAITKGMPENEWVQMQVDTLFAKIQM